MVRKMIGVNFFNKSRRMKSYLLTLLLLCLSLTAGAQHWQFKVGGGFSQLTPDTDPVGTWTIGVGYEWEFDQHWTFIPQLQFGGRGWELPNERVFKKDDGGNVLVNPESGEPLMGWKNTTATAYYLELPLLFNYYLRVAERQYVLLTAGPYLAYGVGGTVKVKGDTDRSGAERMYYDYSTFSGSGFHRFDAGARVGIGFQFANGIAAAIEGSHAFTEIYSGAHNATLQLTLSYLFR